MTFLTLLDAITFVIMIFFTIWNWFQAIFGSTSIEFMRRKGLGIRNSKSEAQLRFKTVSDNLYRIFGTHKLIRIFSPSFRNVPFTGLEWSFRFKDEGYDCDGFKLDFSPRRGASLNPGRPDTEDDEDDSDIEMVTISSLTEEK